MLVLLRISHPLSLTNTPLFLLHNHSLYPLRRPLARVWTVVLLLGTCLLYCARVAMPICAVSMAEKFNWTKREQGMVLGSFFWGYCFTQVLGGYVSDRWATRGDDYSYCLFAHKFAHKLPVCTTCSCAHFTQ